MVRAPDLMDFKLPAIMVVYLKLCDITSSDFAVLYNEVSSTQFLSFVVYQIQTGFCYIFLMSIFKRLPMIFVLCAYEHLHRYRIGRCFFYIFHQGVVHLGQTVRSWYILFIFIVISRIAGCGIAVIQTFLAIYGQDPYVSGLRKMEVAAWMIIFSIWRDDSVILAFDGPA